jgi:hypothetical protein
LFSDDDDDGLMTFEIVIYSGLVWSEIDVAGVRISSERETVECLGSFDDWRIGAGFLVFFCSIGCLSLLK